MYEEKNKKYDSKLSLCGDLYSRIETTQISSKRFTKFLDFWLVQRDERKGTKPFFEVQCRDSSTNELKTYWIPSIKPKKWNPYKGKDRQFFTRETGALMKNLLATRIDLKEEEIEFYYLIEEALRKKYPRIKSVKSNTPSTMIGNRPVLFKTVYRLNFDTNTIDEAIKLAFWKNVNTQAENDTHGIIKRINITQMRKGTSTISNSKQIAQGIYTLSGDGSVKFQNWTDAVALSIKKTDPNFIIYETKDGVINGVSAPPLINTIKKYLIYEDRSTIKSGLRMFNNLITIAGHESILKRGKCNWKSLFPKDIDLNILGIPKSYQSTFVYLEKLNTSGPGGAKWINTFRDEFLIPISDWLSVSGLKDYSKTLYIQNPNTQKKYKMRFNYFSALLKFQAGLGDWREDRWQGSYSKLYVLKYNPEHIFASLKYICEVTQLSGKNRTGKNKEKIIRFFQETDRLKIINPVPVSKNFKFLVTTSSRNQSLSYFSKKYFKNKPIGSKIVQTHLVSVLNNCNLVDIDPWTVQGAINRKVIKKVPKNLREFLTEEGDGPINSFCTSIFVDSDFRNSCKKSLNFELISKMGKYPNRSKYVITQSMKSSKLSDSYGKSFTAANMPDAVANYKKDVGSKELLFIKVVENNLLNLVESDISEILKTNNDIKDPFQVFSAYVFTYSDIHSLPMNFKKYTKLSLQLDKHDADGIINFEIPDLQTIDLMRFGEIWASCKTEVVQNRVYKSSRNKYLENPEGYKDRMISKILEKINTFQKLNPIDRETVQKGLDLVAFGAETRTKFVQDTLQNYLEHIKTLSIIDPSQKTRKSNNVSEEK